MCCWSESHFRKKQYPPIGPDFTSHLSGGDDVNNDDDDHDDDHDDVVVCNFKNLDSIYFLGLCQEFQL